MHLFQVLLHFVWPRELLSTDGAGKHFTCNALVIKERVSLEAVFVLEALKYLDLLAFSTSVGPVIGDEGISEQVEPPDRHILQGLRLCAWLGRQVAPRPRVLRTGGHQGPGGCSLSQVLAGHRTLRTGLLGLPQRLSLRLSRLPVGLA